MTEIAGALISIVLVLLAVFLPVAFLGGVTGTLYKQFAVTIAISMVISGIMALTLSPALAAIILKAHHGEKKGFFRWFENTFERVRQGYIGGVGRVIDNPVKGLVAFAAVLAAVVALFRILPSSFVPEEDQGYFFVVVGVPDSASQVVTGRLARRYRKYHPRRPRGSGRGDGEWLQPDRRAVPEQCGGPLRLAQALRRAQGSVAAVVCRRCRGSTRPFRSCATASSSPSIRHRFPAWARPAASSSTCRIVAVARWHDAGETRRNFSPRREQRHELHGVNTTFRSNSQAAVRRPRPQQG